MHGSAQRVETDTARQDFERAATLLLNPDTRVREDALAATAALKRLITGAEQRGDQAALARYIEYQSQIEALGLVK